MRKCPIAYESLIEMNGAVNEDDGIVVAVKTLKNYATMEQLKALSSELKVMNYIGYHANIVNLLGACTSKLIKGELYVLMEYCCYGNLQQFFQSHRDAFLDENELNTNEQLFLLMQSQNQATEKTARTIARTTMNTTGTSTSTIKDNYINFFDDAKNTILKRKGI